MKRKIAGLALALAVAASVSALAAADTTAPVQPAPQQNGYYCGGPQRGGCGGYYQNGTNGGYGCGGYYGPSTPAKN